MGNNRQAFKPGPEVEIKILRRELKQAEGKAEKYEQQLNYLEEEYKSTKGVLAETQILMDERVELLLAENERLKIENESLKKTNNAYKDSGIITEGEAAEKQKSEKLKRNCDRYEKIAEVRSQESEKLKSIIDDICDTLARYVINEYSDKLEVVERKNGNEEEKE